MSTYCANPSRKTSERAARASSRPAGPHGPAAPGLAPAPNPRGQASVEVLVYVGFFLLVFVVINLLFVLQIGQDVQQRQITLAQASAAQVAEDLQLALSAGPGFAYNFSIPPQINGRPYSVNLTNASSIYVQIDPASSSGPNAKAPVRFFFPLALRSVRLGCLDPECPGNLKFAPYRSVSGQSVQEIGINASKGWLLVNNTLGPDGYPQLVVS